MSTIGHENWAVDLAEVSAIYPFQGWEVVMTVLGVIFWLAFHRIQYMRESAHLERAARLGDQEKVAKMLEDY